jgi:RNA polymerase sigma-70 factor (ECF subfamily)
VKKARSGSLRAFDRLVKKYQRRIYVLIRKMVIDHDDADDIVQEAFVKAFRNLEQFDERFAFYPWLHRIAVNTAINHQKKMSRRMELTRVEDIREPVSNPGESDPSETLLGRELNEKIASAMAQLPFEQRAVFILRTSEELSYQEIAGRLDISIGTVMSRLSRARERLKEILKPYLNGGKG